MYRKSVAFLLAALFAVLCLPALAKTKPGAKSALPSVQLTSVPMLGETDPVKGKVFLEGQDPADYVVIAIVGGRWPKPYFDSYQNRLTASGEEGYASFSFSVTTGGQDTAFNDFTLYLCKAAQFKGVSGSKITDTYMKGRYIQKMVVDKTAFNNQTGQQPASQPACDANIFQVYDDAMVHYGDIAYMGSNDNGSDGSIMMDLSCTENPCSGSACIRITYTPLSKNHWAGVMWLSGANNFPPNLPADGVDAGQVKQLTFCARGSGATKFFIENDRKQQVTKNVRLTEDWTQYTLDIPSDWEHICVGFGFASNGAAGKGVIYLDDIAYNKN